jgi:hypothetical protein
MSQDLAVLAFALLGHPPALKIWFGSPRTVTDLSEQASYMLRLVDAWARQNPQEAERLARTIAIPEPRAIALVTTAKALESQNGTQQRVQKTGLR